jgi:hypothetical protein
VRVVTHDKISERLLNVCGPYYRFCLVLIHLAPGRERRKVSSPDEMAQMGDIGQFPAVGTIVACLDRPSPRDDQLEESSQI